MGFEAVQGIPYVRCIGHGGIPVVIEPGATSAPIPSPGVWEESASFAELGQNWHRFGFAVLDFNGEQIEVRYRDDDGTQVRTESIP